jgi:hypothetical protein
MRAFIQRREPFNFPGSKSTPARTHAKNKSRIRGVFITLTDNQEHEAAGSIRGDDNSGIALKLGIVAIITAERPAYELHDVVIREAAREYLSDTSHTGGLASRSLVA